eukprot:scaffold75239_cov33-Tisochrysis_lutea.AAC.2
MQEPASPRLPLCADQWFGDACLWGQLELGGILRPTPRSARDRRMRAPIRRPGAPQPLPDVWRGH